ncbi:MAG: tetraacyldisaccharide 4'-kinase [Candidatus Cloacimonetes bacterium]|nr:tetraacyldisaccharide 4'-kinase [Candidatus Cloacimonadota bacterium]
MRWRRNLYAHKGYRAPFKVISIGNLVIGGSGKTPIAIAICNALHQKGLRVAYASRGYKSGLEQQAKLVWDGSKLFFNAHDAGDEAVMAAKMLPGIPVFSGAKRKQVLMLVHQIFPNLDAIILDDAFQHLKVARDLDIIVFDTELALGNGFTIPAGYLREDLSALDSRSICLLHQKPGSTRNPSLEKRLRSTGAKVYQIQSSCKHIYKNSIEIDPKTLESENITVVSGIANPRSLEQGLAQMGIRYQKHLRFGDHHSFIDDASRNTILNDTSKYIICTAKDAVKLKTLVGSKMLVISLSTTLPEDLINSIISTINR